MKATTEPDATLEAQGNEKLDSDDDEDFELDSFLKGGYFERQDKSGSTKKVGVVYKYLTIQSVRATRTFVRTLPYAVISVRTLKSFEKRRRC